MASLAADLKTEREKRNTSLAQIAADTRISLHYLESLEEGRFGDLPGGMYNRAFLKAYCETLDLNNLQEIMQRYEDEISPSSDRPVKSKVHIPQQSRSFSISPIVIWGFMLLISAAGLFFSRNWITAVFSPYFSHTSPATVRYETVQQPVKKPAAPPAATVDPSVASSIPPPETAAPAATPPALATSAPSSAPLVNNTAAESKSDVSPEPAPAASGAESLSLEISATERCWVSVDRDGSPAFRKTMEPG